MTINEIEKLALSYSGAHTALVMEVEALDAELQAVKRARLSALRQRVAVAKERRGTLEAAVEGSAELFLKPRTLILYGIKVGFRKQKGGLAWEDAQKVVERIEKFYDADAAQYLHVTKKPDREALDKLTVCDLRKLGIEVVADSDKVVVEPVDGEVDKIVAALIKDAPEQ